MVDSHMARLVKDWFIKPLCCMACGYLTDVLLKRCSQCCWYLGAMLVWVLLACTATHPLMLFQQAPNASGGM